MDLISIATATTLTDWSERTFWRRFADGSVGREIETGKSMVDLETLRPHFCVPLEQDDISLIKEADAGDVDAQNDLAMLFLANDKPRNAIYWLELAVKQDHADAMHWLARCYFDGNGVLKDENMGLMWLSKSAAHGHIISQVQMKAMIEKFTEGT